MRVLHCIYDDPANPWVAGGGAVRVLELYRQLAGRVEATVLSGNYPGARGGMIDGVRYVRLGAARPYAWSRLSYGVAATRRLQTGEYDAAVFDFSAYTPLLIPRDRPVGATVHHLTGPTAAERWGPVLAGVITAAERRMLARARYFSATSGATRELLREYAAPDAKVVSVAAGVPDDLFLLERSEEEYVLYFGRMDWFHKGLDTLLDAFALLAEGHLGLELRMAGRGKDAERVARRVRDLGLEARVRLLGEVSAGEQRRLFAGAKVQLMPSRFEGFGMVAAEAMAAGVPLVTSSAGSLPEVVAPPEGGVIVPPGNAAALAAAVDELLNDEGARAQLSRQARRSAERYRWEKVAADHFDFLQLIASGA